MFDSVPHQIILCKEIRRLLNEKIKQLAVKFETKVRKSYSPNMHDYKKTKKTEVLGMTLTPPLCKIAM